MRWPEGDVDKLIQVPASFLICPQASSPTLSMSEALPKFYKPLLSTTILIIHMKSHERSQYFPSNPKEIKTPEPITLKATKLQWTPVSRASKSWDSRYTNRGGGHDSTFSITTSRSTPSFVIAGGQIMVTWRWKPHGFVVCPSTGWSGLGYIDLYLPLSFVKEGGLWWVRLWWIYHPNWWVPVSNYHSLFWIVPWVQTTINHDDNLQRTIFR